MDLKEMSSVHRVTVNSRLSLESTDDSESY